MKILKSYEERSKKSFFKAKPYEILSISRILTIKKESRLFDKLNYQRSFPKMLSRIFFPLEDSTFRFQSLKKPKKPTLKMPCNKPKEHNGMGVRETKW